MASIIKNKDIYDPSQGDPLKSLKDSLDQLDTQLQGIEKRVNDFTQELRDVKKTGTGQELKQLTEGMQKLNSETEKYTKVSESRSKIAKQIENAERKLVELYDDEAQQLTEVNLEIQQRRQQLKAIAKENKVAADSVDGIRLNLTRLKKEYKQLSKAQRENDSIGGELLRNIQELDREYKELSKSQGEFQVDVGNYPGLLGRAANGVDLLSGGLKGLIKQSLAFIATPLGAVLTAITAAVGLFSSALSRNASTQEKAARVSGSLKGVWNALLDSIGDLIDEGLDQLNIAIDSVLFGLTKLGILDKDSKLLNTIKETRELEAAEQALIFAQQDLEDQQLRSQLQAEKLRQIRDDDSQSIEARIQANKQLGAVLDAQIVLEKQLAQQVLDAALKRARVEGQTIDNQIAIREARRKFLEIEERVEGQRSEQLTNTNALLREQKRIYNENFNQGVQQSTKELELIDKEIEAVEEENEALIELEELKNEELLNVDLEFQDSKTTQLEEAEKKRLEIEQSFAEQRKQLIAQTAEFAGEQLVNLIASGEASFKEFGKFLITLSLDVIERLILLAIAETTAKQIASKGVAGIASAALLVGIIKGTFAAIKSQVQNFATGTEYVNGPGTSTSDSIPANLSKGERVVDAKNNKKLNGISNKDLPELATIGKLVKESQIVDNSSIEKKLDRLGVAYKKGDYWYLEKGNGKTEHWKE